MNTQITKILQAISKGAVVVHPTDTIIGLGCDPTHPQAVKSLLEIKGYSNARQFIHLVADFAQAIQMFAELPKDWSPRLEQIWPAPLSVVWRVKPGINLPSIDPLQKSIAIRVPNLLPSHSWLYSILKRLPYGLISTSVNIQGEAPCRSWQEAKEKFAGKTIFFPENQLFEDSKESSSPSTIIQLTPDGEPIVLRRGAETFNFSL